MANVIKIQKESRKKKLSVLRGSLNTKFQPFARLYRDIGDYLLQGKVDVDKRSESKGDRRSFKVIDSTATIAHRTAQAGMMGGITSPARRWFKLSTPDPDLMEIAAVKEWLHVTTNRMNATFLKSNIYDSLPVLYGDLLALATGAILVEEDFEKTLHSTMIAPGSFRIALNGKGQVGTFLREFQYTVRQLVDEFGIVTSGGMLSTENLSTQVANYYSAGNLDAKVDICHVVYENSDYDPKQFGDKRFTSVYYETSTEDGDGKGADGERYLRDKGYDYFPVLVPRWSVTGGDIYGTGCPGFLGLGDIKSLQLNAKRMAQGDEKALNPPLSAPIGMANKGVSVLPGAVNYDDSTEGRGLRPAYEVKPDKSGTLEQSSATQFRLQRIFFEDLFLMLQQSDRRNVTATEIVEKHKERLLILGPVLERLNTDLLDPLIDILFQLMTRQGEIPEPPEELAGKDLKVEYISILHQAQKLAGLDGIERVVGFVLNLSEVFPEARDKLDIDKTIDAVAEVTGVPPEIINTEDEVVAVREERQRILEEREKADQAVKGAQAAKDLANAPLDQNSALGALGEQAAAGQ